MNDWSLAPKEVENLTTDPFLARILGVGYSRPLGQWSGEIPGAHAAFHPLEWE